MNLNIFPEFKSLMLPLSSEEYKLLEQSIISEGCRDALIIWNYNNQPTIIDGHNRYEICQKNNIDFEIEYIDFESKADAKIWIVKNQLGRRNVPAFVKIELAKLIEPEIKEKARGNQVIRKGNQAGATLLKSAELEAIDTREEIAKVAGVSHDTVAKASKIMEKSSNEVKQKVRNNEVSINKAYKDIIRQENREKQTQQLIEIPLPTNKYDVIYADPPWQYEHSETLSRDIENQYPTMDLESIKALNIPSADNAILFLWATAPKLEEALQVINAWGFKYRTCSIWDKEMIGMGYWFRGQHEILLVAIKGNILTPDPEIRESSVYREKRQEHSKKPDYYYDLIEKYFPHGKYLELFARGKHNDKWTIWGNETNS